MTQEHPITPPPELVHQWFAISCGSSASRWKDIVTQAARWGADQELEACCEWVEDNFDHCNSTDRSDWLRAARRPKPPSLKVQALEALDEEHADMRIQNYKLIRSVLESLPD